MSNMMEKYFSEALQKIPPVGSIEEMGLPEPDYPKSEPFSPESRTSEDDDVSTVSSRWAAFDKAEILNRGPINPIVLTKSDEKLIDGGLREIGVDIFAFYKSRRYVDKKPYPGKWGVFYVEQGVQRIAQLIELTYPGYGRPYKWAYELLRAHERFHFKFDLSALAFEAANKKALYDPLKYCFRNCKEFLVEEALANKEAWLWAKQPRIGLGDFAYNFSKLQPGAYGRFDEDWAKLGGELAANLIDLNFSQSARRDDLAYWLGTVPDVLLRKSLCPEYFVRPADLTAWIDPAWRLPAVLSVTESPKVQKLLLSKFKSIKTKWNDTKKKLIKDSAIPGLDFKRWDKKEGLWSVRVDLNFRAHIRAIKPKEGAWEAVEIGPHKAMGHG